MANSGRRRNWPRIRLATTRVSLLASPADRQTSRRGVDEPPKWRSRRPLRLLTVITGITMLVFAGWLAWVGYLFFARGGPSAVALDPDRRCSSLGFSCGVLTNLLASGVLVAFASSFVLWRLFGLQRRYRARARDDSRELVPTAGAIIDRVVGRDDLCLAVMADLHDPGSRPHVIAGGVGTGKTAVLVRLTELLAEKRAIPVPIRLRDATADLDFEALARDRFLSEINARLFSSAEGETIWRRLLRDGKIIVLADGLEEALVAEPERDTIIRAAIRRAHQQQLPLVIASRPHDPLRATDAAVLVLEPLSYEAALAYIAAGGPAEDERRLAWIIETAEVTEAPIYLQITRELKEKGLLEPSSADQRGIIDTRGVDRSRLRLSLLETWEHALVAGHLREDVPLSRAERHAAVEHASVLACLGLRFDRLEVDFDDLPDAALQAELRRRLAVIDEEAGQTPGVHNVDVRLAAAWAAQLELVELRGNSVRFPHSLLQAYLGSRLLGTALADPAYLSQAVTHPRPGREFLIALVLHSRRDAVPGALVTDLRTHLGTRDDTKVLDAYAAALEIDCVAAEPAHARIATEITDRWARIHTQDPRTLQESKLAVVQRMGEAARMIDRRRERDPGLAAGPAYPQLYAIACAERTHAVQLAAVQQIGTAGPRAYAALRTILQPPCAQCAAERAARSPGDAAAAARGQDAVAEASRAATVSAWLAPVLAASMSSISGPAAERALGTAARADLAQWLRHIGSDERRSGETDLPISLEIALAQGFKYAANLRPGRPDTLREARLHLAEQALEMLRGARYWFSQLTLLHALCLLNLSDAAPDGDERRRARPEVIVQRWLDATGREHRQATGGEQLHPFVREAAMLIIEALRTGLPQRYCWIDESAVVGQVGSRNLGQGTPHGRHRLWIPPSAGWTALDARAQQLVADVLLLVNLADRGEGPAERERRLKRSALTTLPPCISHDREALEPARSVGMARSAVPGTSCVDGCVFELCPYPPKGAVPRVEMSEAFCRRQQTLITRPKDPRTGRAPWQKTRPRQLKHFWADMADRARGPGPARPAGR